MAWASALQASNAEEANELWAEVEHEFVDQPVAVSLAYSRNHVFVSKRVGN